MLQHLDAHDEVVLAVERLGQRPAPRVLFDRVVDGGDRILGGVDAVRVDVEGAELLDEHPERATGVEHRLGLYVRQNAARDPSEIVEPIVVAFERNVAFVQVSGPAVFHAT